MAYTHFQYLAYQTPTFGFDSTDGSFLASLAPGDLCDAVDDIPVPDNLGLSDDAKKRLRRLAAVVEKAHSELVGDQDTTLKVFVAPEFYFRPEAATNSHTYSQEERSKILVALGLMFKNAKFDHWLIVAGTVIANIPVVPVTTPKTYYYYNTAIAIKGGTNCKLSAIEKQQPSGIDGVPVNGGITSNTVAAGNYKEHFEEWSTKKERLFNVDGVQLGLDICLDHAGPVSFHPASVGYAFVQDTLRMTKRVANESLSQPPLPAPLPDIALHILTAGGMPIVPQSLAAKNGGYILRTDGHPGMNPTIDFKRVTNYTTPTGTTNFYDMTTGIANPAPAVDGSSSTFPNCPVANMVNVASINTSALTGKLKVPIPDRYNRGGMGQNIVTYPVTAMP